jgi:hypothetical protein
MLTRESRAGLLEAKGGIELGEGEGSEPLGAPRSPYPRRRPQTEQGEVYCGCPRSALKVSNTGKVCQVRVVSVRWTNSDIPHLWGQVVFVFVQNVQIVGGQPRAGACHRG